MLHALLLWLVDSVWQSAILALTAEVTIRWFVIKDAKAAKRIWMMTLATAIALPLLTSVLVIPSDLGFLPHRAASLLLLPETPSHLLILATRSLAANPISPWVGFAIAILWAACATIKLVRLVFDVHAMRRITAEAWPFCVGRRSAMPRLAEALQRGRRVRVGISDTIEVPVAVGIFEPVAIIPRGLLNVLDRAELEQVILHEVAHLKQWDDWGFLGERCVRAIMFFNPFVQWILARLEIEREVICDEIAAADGLQYAYAACLIKTARNVKWYSRTLTAPGAFSSRRTLSLRIDRLLESRQKTGRFPFLTTVAALFIASSLGVIVGRTLDIPLVNTTNAAAIVPYVNGDTFARGEVHRLTTAFESGTVSSKSLNISMPASDAKRIASYGRLITSLGPPSGERLDRIQTTANGTAYIFDVRYKGTISKYRIVLRKNILKSFEVNFKK